MPRTFIAIAFPLTIHQALDERSQALRTYLRAHHLPDGLRWATLANAHLTLRFLGDTTTAQMQALAPTLHALAAAHTPFELALGNIGGFPTLRQPRVIWLGLVGDLAPLNALQAAVEQLVQQVGFTAETRPFSPHITLARAGRAATSDQLRRIGQLVKTYRDISTNDTTTLCRWPVDAFVHLQSDLHPTGAVYRALARLPLGSQSQR